MTELTPPISAYFQAANAHDVRLSTKPNRLCLLADDSHVIRSEAAYRSHTMAEGVRLAKEARSLSATVHA